MKRFVRWGRGSSAIGLAFWLLLGLSSCGGTTRGAPGAGGSTNAGANSGPSTGGDPGAPSAAGQAGESQVGPKPHLSGATPEEETILDPLFWDPAVSADASIETLVALGARVGLARGYAMCRCVASAEQPPENVAQVQASCAKDEAGLLRGFNWYPSAEQGPRPNEDLARCLSEEQAPWLAEALRCELARHQMDGRAWLGLCAVPHARSDSSAWPEPPAHVCPDEQKLSQVLETCQWVGYCADGTRISPGRCSASTECADGSDERGCFDYVGFDMLQCGDEIAQPGWLCGSDCGYETTPPLCDEARRERFLCADGTDVDLAVVCDRKADCADETDELYCLR